MFQCYYLCQRGYLVHYASEEENAHLVRPYRMASIGVGRRPAGFKATAIQRDEANRGCETWAQWL
jgi:hypothetical protein